MLVEVSGPALWPGTVHTGTCGIMLLPTRLPLSSEYTSVDLLQNGHRVSGKGRELFIDHFLH